MRHPFKIETFTQRAGAWQNSRIGHAATLDLAVAMAGLRAEKAAHQKHVTTTTVHFRMVDGSWQDTGTALVTRPDGKVAEVPTTLCELPLQGRHMGLS